MKTTEEIYVNAFELADTIPEDWNKLKQTKWFSEEEIQGAMDNCAVKTIDTRDGCDTKMKIKDMPKLKSPFIREKINGKFVVTNKIEEGYGWVFEDNSVMAIEKLNGMNVSIYIDKGIITHIWSRNRRVPFFNIEHRKVIDGLLNSYEKGYLEFLPDGQHFGELIGPGVEGNSYKLQKHLWIPFQTYALKTLKYNSWGKYPKDFDAISKWFKELLPLFAKHRNLDSVFVEGIVFTHPDGRMAKLRCDMFDWYYEQNLNAKQHKGLIK